MYIEAGIPGRQYGPSELPAPDSIAFPESSPSPAGFPEGYAAACGPAASTRVSACRGIEPALTLLLRKAGRCFRGARPPDSADRPDHPDVDESLPSRRRTRNARRRPRSCSTRFRSAISTSFTINARRRFFSLYVRSGRSVSRPAKLRGRSRTTSSRIVRRGNGSVPRSVPTLIADTIEFAAAEFAFNASRCGAHFATPAPTQCRRWRSRSWTASPTATR